MTENASDDSRPLTRKGTSDAVRHLGWRLVLGALHANVRAESLAQAAEIAGQLATIPALSDQGRLWLDIRPHRVGMVVRPPVGPVTMHEVDIATRISTRLGELGHTAEPDLASSAVRSVQALEIAIDAMDIPAIRPFWKAVLGYVDERPNAGPEDGLIDPMGQSPAVWFQQMDEPRPQRNRIHLDVSVPHDEAAHRIEQTLAAGGILRSDAGAPSFWVLADAEGNEACVSTWQGRD